MGKSTHFIGQPVYNQVIKLLDKQQIKQISLETPRSEAYVKRLDGWTHLVIMLFGVLKHLDSLREVEIGIKAEINYCCPVKINWKLCISLSIGIAAVLLIQGLGFQFQTVSIIKCTYFDKKRPIITDNSKK